MAKDFAKIDDRQWRFFLDKVGRNIKDGARLLDVAAKTHGFKDIITHFKQEQGPDGKWENLKRSTIEKRTKGAGVGRAKILQDTGRLRNSIINKLTRRRGHDQIEMFSNVSYSGKHDRGDSSENLPQRQFMWLSDGAQELMAQTIIELSLRGT